MGNETMWVRLIFAPITFTSKNPDHKPYPKQLVTLGDHLRNERLTRDMTQPNVADIFGVTPDTITNWELNRNEPTAKDAKKIIEFLGYIPFDFVNTTLGLRLKYARSIAGMSQKQAAKSIGCDASNLRIIELGSQRPFIATRTKIDVYIEKVLANFCVMKDGTSF